MARHHRRRSPASGTRSRAQRRAVSSISIVGHHRNTRHETVRRAPATALVFLGFLSLILAVINLFPFLPLDGGHIAVGGGREGPRPADLAGRRCTATARSGSCCCCSWSSTASATTSAAWRADAHPALDQARDALRLGGAEQCLDLAVGSAARSPPSCRSRRGASSDLRRRAGSQWAPGSSECGSIGNESAGVCTNHPRPTRRSLGANAGRRAGGTCSITLEQYTRSNSSIGEWQPLGDVGAARTLPGRRGARAGPRPVISSSGSSARRPMLTAADVQHARLGRPGAEREEALVAAGAGTRRPAARPGAPAARCAVA